MGNEKKYKIRNCLFWFWLRRHFDISSQHGTRKRTKHKHNGPHKGPTRTAITPTVIIDKIRTINSKDIISQGQTATTRTLINNRTLTVNRLNSAKQLSSNNLERTHIIRSPPRTIINPKISEESNRCCNKCHSQLIIWLEQLIRS